MKKLVNFASGLAVIGMIFAANPALAASPMLSLSNNGGDNVTVTVTSADPNSSVQLNYIQPGSSLATTISNFGYTNYSGYFTTSISANAYGINSGSQVYVTVNGQQSNYTTISGYSGGCTYNCGNPYTLSLSQNNVSLNVGQTATVTVTSSMYYNSFYISSNSNSSVVDATTYGTSVQLIGRNPGSSSVVVCNGSACGTINVTVTGYMTGSLTFNPTNPTMSVGQSLTVTVSAPYLTGNFYISGNSNPNAATASISGNTITLYGQNNGSTTVNVCATNSSCASLYVTVSGSGSGVITFSQSNLNMTVGQNQTIAIYGNTSSMVTFYYSGSSNTSVASATISGRNAIVHALANGTSTITICQSTGGCGSFNVSVGGGSGGNLSLSQTNLNLNVGQTSTVTAYNTSSIYISSNSNPAVASANIMGSTQININALSAGSTNIYVCGNNASQCSTINVGVYGGSSALTFSQNNVTLVTGQSGSYYIYSNSTASGSYYISNQSNSGVASASISGSSLNIFAQSAGSNTITVCQYGSGFCGTFNLTVNGSTGSGSVWFSNSNLTLSAGQTQGVTIYSSYGSSSYYISSNSNSYVASASVSGTNLNITAQNPGSTALTVCANGNGCGTMNVTVNNQYSGGTFSIIIPSQPAINVGQYFSMQLQVNGGNSPYTFIVSSGGLPNGLNLSSSGQIFGTPTYAQTTTFTVQAQDAYGRVASQPVTLTIGGSVLGSSIYKTGLIMGENGTVYMVYKNTKSGFASRSVFEGLGFNFNQVTNTGYSGIPDSGYTIRSAKNSHPWGSWVKSGTTVYFVHDSGLIAVPDYATFVSNGGEDRLVVQASSYDFRLPMLSVMVFNDPRVK